MDKLDAWMERALEESSGSESKKSASPNKGKSFTKGEKRNKKHSGKKSKHGKNPHEQKRKDGKKGKHGKKPHEQKKKDGKAGGKPKKQDEKKSKYKKGKKADGHTSAPSPILKPTPVLKGKLKMVPLGGLDEVGKNMLALEYEDDIIILDMGFEFPDEDMRGIDYVIPDTSYLEANKKRIRGVVLTHGHLDHIGGIPYILPKLDFPPVYGTKLTIGLAKRRTEEFKQEKMTKLNVIDPKETIKLGKFTCSFFRVAHSIPDSVGIVVDTPVGKVVDTGDFKFDDTPIGSQHHADIGKMKALGTQNVMALFCEATNALKPGHSISEREVQKTLNEIVGKTEGRIVVSSFSSQIGRIQQLLDAAAKNGRKVFVSGRSMLTNIKIASELGYLKFPKELVSEIKKYKNVADKKTLIITTGSQGESISALARMAANEHAHIKIKEGDTIILSSSPIIGNERAIHTVINRLTKLGANVIHNALMDVHTSGHGNRDELARMINYIKPKYLIPIHGEFYMRKALMTLAQEKCGMKPEKTIMIENGDVLLAEKGRVYVSKEKVDTKYILIDGSGEGKLGSQVQVDREIMSQNGALIVLIYISKKSKKIVKEPDVVSRGFVYMHETDEITKEVIKLAEKAYKDITKNNPGANRADVKKYIRQTIDKYTHNALERRPLIVPLIVDA